MATAHGSRQVRRSLFSGAQLRHIRKSTAGIIRSLTPFENVPGVSSRWKRVFRLHDVKESTLAKDHRSSVKNDKQYEGLRKEGMSKSRAAAISNSPGASSRGGKSSGSSQSRRSSGSGSGGNQSQKKSAGRKGGKKSS